MAAGAAYAQPLQDELLCLLLMPASTQALRARALDVVSLPAHGNVVEFAKVASNEHDVLAAALQKVAAFVGHLQTSSRRINCNISQEL